MRAKRFVIMLALALVALGGPQPASAQRSVAGVLEHVPIGFTIGLSQGRPDVSVGGMLIQTAAGIGGGILGAMVVGVPILLGTYDNPDPIDEGLGLLAMGAAYVGGTVYGVHLAGRWSGQAANPWATTAGVLGGLVIGGAVGVEEAEDGTAEPSILIFTAPAMGGTLGYTLTRRAR